MKRSWTALFLAAGALPAAALAGPQYSAEEIIEHFSQTSPAGSGTSGAATGGGTAAAPVTRGVFVGAAGFGSEATAAAAASQGASGAAAAQADAVAPQADAGAPLAIPMTGANAGQGAGQGAKQAAGPGAKVAAGSGPVVGVAPPAGQDPGSYDLLITFELDSAMLTPQARENLDAFVAALRSRALQPFRFSVEGHTDATGPQGYNQVLSERRAASVVDYLVAHGVEGNRLVARGYGETRPSRADPEHPENRRVETRRIE